MDSYRDIPSELESAVAAEDQDNSNTVAAIGTDERRMHVRAYNHWVSLLDGRDYPSIEDLEPGDLVDFAGNSILLDFTGGRDNPATPYVGVAIREECDLAGDVNTIADVPSRSLLSRLTDHYMEIIANRAPVGFEAEFENQRGENIRYRGILMPFSSDGDTIDFIYGVINWKTVGVSIESAVAAEQPAISPDLDVPEVADAPDSQAEEPAEEPLELTDRVEVPMLSAAERTDQDLDESEAVVAIDIGEDAGLADRLWVARETADALKAAEGRTRESLYRALSCAYDFALAAREEPEDFAELLEESGVKAQSRAPMTPVVKLVFGIDCDKARITEYSAALAYADRQEVAAGGFFDFIEAQAGGLKALVAAERQARRPDSKPESKTAQARKRLRTAAPVALDSIASDEEFALVLTRRSDAGRHEAIALVDDPALVERAIRKVGG